MVSAIHTPFFKDKPGLMRHTQRYGFCKSGKPCFLNVNLAVMKHQAKPIIAEYKYHTKIEQTKR